jgi:hypothetical protein
MELDRRGAELLFQVLTEREVKNSIAIASNHAFSGWTRTFTDPRLCAVIVDRLTFNGAIIETGTESDRLGHTKNQQERRSEGRLGPEIRQAATARQSSAARVADARARLRSCPWILCAASTAAQVSSCCLR